MHELSISKGIVDMVLQAAGNRRTVAATVVVGEWCGVVDDYLRQYFELLTEGSLAEGATLNILREAPCWICLQCGQCWSSKEVVTDCSVCGSSDLQLQGGLSLTLQSVEVLDEDTCC